VETRADPRRIQAPSESPVDRLVHEWERIRPDLDFGPMALFALSNRFASLGVRQVESALADHGIALGEFDVLSALRRAGQPFSLRPSDLADRLMVTKAGITARVDRLEAGGLVARKRDPADRRSEPITLTRPGLRVIDLALVTVLEVESQLFEELTPSDRKALERILRRLERSGQPPSGAPDRATPRTTARRA
jgi:DNA-binding MarR family transcriptional regulator